MRDKVIEDIVYTSIYVFVVMFFIFPLISKYFNIKMEEDKVIFVTLFIATAVFTMVINK
jgi:hypothetical protein